MSVDTSSPPPKMSSILGKTGVVVGNVTGMGDVEIRGRVQGSIELSGRVLVSESGLVQGGIEAVTITVAGEVRGDLIAEDGVFVRASGQVTGNIAAPRVGIEAGARVLGHLRTGDAPAPKTTPVEGRAKGPAESRPETAEDRARGTPVQRKPAAAENAAAENAAAENAAAENAAAENAAAENAAPETAAKATEEVLSERKAEPPGLEEGAEERDGRKPARKRRRRRSGERRPSASDSPEMEARAHARTEEPRLAELHETPQEAAKDSAAPEGKWAPTPMPRVKKAKPAPGAKMPTFRKGAKGRQKPD